MRLFSRYYSIFTIIVIFTINYKLNAVDLKGLLNSHDPATLIKDGNTYWHFTTGDGIWSSVSTSLEYWSASNKPVFKTGTWPGWINTYVPDFKGNFWAPDITYMNGAYYIYYSCSSWGKTTSAIGVAKSTSLNSPNWIDLGMVVSSNGSTTAINAIDPGIFRDDDGQTYMVYGSWFGGIGIVDIDSITGKATSAVTHLYGGEHQSIEAPYLFKEDGYYFLVVNRGTCCDGVNSTYYITVGRSEYVKGPYTDFRNLLTKSGKYIGPGHFGLLREACVNYVSTHYYDGADNGFPKLDILKMNMLAGWPSLTRDFTFEKCDGPSVSTYEKNNNLQPLRIFPNPATTGFLSIEINPNVSPSDNLKIQILSSEGNTVYSECFEKTNLIDISHGLNQGIYFLSVESEGFLYTEKLIIK